MFVVRQGSALMVAMPSPALLPPPNTAPPRARTPRGRNVARRGAAGCAPSAAERGEPLADDVDQRAAAHGPARSPRVPTHRARTDAR